VKISCVSCCDVFLEKTERTLSIWLTDDISSGALVRKKGSFHSSEGWLEKLGEWVNTHNMNTLELPSADCEAK